MKKLKNQHLGISCLKMLFRILKFTLLLLIELIATKTPKKREPTLNEIMYGEKLACTDEYFIHEPDSKSGASYK